MTSTEATGVIEGVPLLDLSHATSADDLAHISAIRSVATVVVPEQLASALTRIPMESVAQVIHAAEGAHVRVHTGAVLLGGDALAEPGGDNEVLVVTGGLIVTSPIERIGFRQVFVTGAVVAPYGSESALGAGLTGVTGAVVYYRLGEDQRFHQLNGTTRISGESMANPGRSPDDILLANGQLLITSPVREVGYQQVIMSGQLLAPRESEPVLMPKLTLNGQAGWYDGTPRFLVGDERYGKAFFELLDRESLAFVGDMVFEDDVTAEVLMESVTEIILVGEIRAPRDAVPAVQALTREKYGEILASEDAD